MAVIASLMELVVLLVSILVSLVFLISMLLVAIMLVTGIVTGTVLFIDLVLGQTTLSAPPGESILVDFVRVALNPARNALLVLLLLFIAFAFWLEERIVETNLGRVIVAISIAYLAYLFVYVPVFQLTEPSLKLFVFQFPIYVAMPAVFAGTRLKEIGLLDWFGPSAAVGSSSATALPVVAVTLVLIVICCRLASVAMTLGIGSMSSALYRRHVRFSVAKGRARRRIWRRLDAADAKWVIKPTLAAFVRSALVIWVPAVIIYAEYRLGRPFSPAVVDALRNPLSTWDFLPPLSPNATFTAIVYVPTLAVLVTLIFKWRGKPNGRLMTELLVAALLFPVVLPLIDSRAKMFIFVAFPAIAALLAVRCWIWRGLTESIVRFRAAIQPRANYEQIADAGPILYLRAFLDDPKALSAKFSLINFVMGVKTAGRRFEELVAQRAFNWRPIVALGNHRETLRLNGVLKFEAIPRGGKWKPEVIRLVEASAYTVMIANATDNIAWELNQLRDADRIHKTIFVITDGALGSRFFAHYAIIDTETAVHPDALIVYYDSDLGWTAITSIIRTSSAYSIALDIALARMEEGLETASAAPIAQPTLPLLET